MNPKCIFIAFLPLLAGMAAAEEKADNPDNSARTIIREWTYDPDKPFPDGDIHTWTAPGHSWTTTVSTDTKTPDGKIALALHIDTSTDTPQQAEKQLVFRLPAAVDKGQKYRFHFHYRGTVPGEAYYSAARTVPPYSAVGQHAGRLLKVTDEWREETLEFTVADFVAAPVAMPRFFIGRYPKGGTLYLGPIRVERLDAERSIASLLGGEWRFLTEPRNETAPVDRIPDEAVPVQMTDNTLDIGKREGSFGTGQSAVFYQEFDADADGTMTLGMAADWFFACFVNGQPVYDTLRSGNRSHRYSPEDHVFNAPVRKGRNLVAVRVLSGSAGWRFVAGKVPPVDGDPELARLFKPEAGADFRPVDEGHFLEVKPGTALDFSALDGRARPAGTLGRLVVGANGKPVFEKAPDRPVRFFAFNLSLSTHWMWRDRFHEWDYPTIDRFADAIDRRGYNMVRLHVPEKFLVGWDVIAKFRKNTLKDVHIPQTRAELEAVLDAGNFDRFDYLVHALKERGIYVNLDLASFAMITPTGDGNEAHEDHFKTRLFHDPVYRRHWRVFVEYLMDRVNPHTGKAYRDEPALALVNFINEQDLHFVSGLGFLTGAFRNHLREKYGTDTALAEAWQTTLAIDQVPDIRESDLRSGDRRAEDTGNFLIETMREMTVWFHDTLRAAGYPGLVHHWDMIMRGLEIPGRALMPVVSQHVYFAHPNPLPPRGLLAKGPSNTYVGNQNTDLLVGQGSSLNASYFRAGAAARFFDRPYFNTEYSHAAPNRYRHERGLYFSSFAALQDWDAITAHEKTVRLHLDPFLRFDNAADPVSRANEALAALIYLRRDVDPAPHSVALELREADLFPKHYLAAIGDDYAKLAMVTRLGILYPDVKPLDPVGRFSPTLTLRPSAFSPLQVTQWYVSADAEGSGRSAELFRTLRERGILATDNPSDPERRRYVSETGQIDLRGESETMIVATPRLEGAIIKKDEPVRVGKLAVESCSRAASVTLAAIDGQKGLDKAERMLLTLATNAFNTGQVFDTVAQGICYEAGDRPALVEAARFDLSVGDGRTELPAVYTLHFDGTRAQRLEATREEGRLRLRIDTGKLRHGSMFFELDYRQGAGAEG